MSKATPAQRAAGSPAEAVDCLQQLLRLQRGDAAVHRRLGNALLACERFEEAVECYRASLAIEPENVRAHNNLGQALMRLTRGSEALQSFERATALNPAYAIAHNNMGVVLFESGDSERALACYQRAIELDPGFFEALRNCGHTLLHMERAQDALLHYERALLFRPASCETLLNRGIALQRLDRIEQALDSYQRVLQLVPDHAEALSNSAGALLALKRPEEALHYAERAIGIRHAFAEAYSNLGGALRALHRYEEAAAACEQALQIKPGFAEAWSNLANVMLALNRTRDAIAHCERAIELRPRLADAYDRLAWALLVEKRPDESVRRYAQLQEIARGREFLPGAILGAQLAGCDWSQYDERTAALTQAVVDGGRAVSPFAFLTLSDSVEAQLKCARIFAAAEMPAICRQPWSGVRHQHQRIRVAYLSADFHYHATAMLAAGLFEAHDRERFETIAVSFGPEDWGPVRQRLVRGFDRFLDVRRISDIHVVELLRSLEIDIAVDLKGYTQDGRAGIFSRRAAPVQVSYLGYPGTLGLEEMDYIIADPIVLPPQHQSHYSERVVYMPDCYQVNDDRRTIAESAPTRVAAGLPADGFVFCCFNNNHKITPAVFDIWMRLLQRLPGSVLWLLQDNPVAADNLRREAARRGVAAERLVFAPRVPADEHLARHRLADLFLDTLPYNAHTTSSDALWSGLPLLTCLGSTFAGRVAASLLHAVGLPELVTTSLEQYEAQAFDLASDPAKLLELRDRLARNRLTYPLFDTASFCRHLETAYSMMWQRYQQGLAPENIVVPATTVGGAGLTRCSEAVLNP